MSRTDQVAAPFGGLQSLLGFPRARRPMDSLDDDGAQGRSTQRPILIIHSSDDMYGADRMVLEVIGALTPAERDRVLVWLPTDYEHGEKPLCTQLDRLGIACEHVALPIARRRYLNARGLSAMGGRILETRRRLAQIDPSDVILATSAVLPVAPFLKWGSSTRVVLHMQEVWQGREGQALGALASRVDRVIAISEAARSSLPEALQRRAVVVPNGTAEPGEGESLEAHSGELTFVVASRWNEWKGHRVLIDAWDRAGCPGTLVILGGPPSMGAGVDVAEMVANSREPESIRILGEVQDAGPIIDSADVMIVPSTSPEPFGLVTIEAFARSRPVIASANGGLLETVQEGAGWLVEPGDVAELADRLRTLTRHEVEIAGVRARRRYERFYSREAFSSALREALELDVAERGDSIVLTDGPDLRDDSRDNMLGQRTGEVVA